MKEIGIDYIQPTLEMMIVFQKRNTQKQHQKKKVYYLTIFMDNINEFLCFIYLIMW